MTVEFSSETHRGRSGFLLVEMLLGIGLFAMFVAAISLTMLLGQEGTESSGDHARSLFLTEQALEGIRSIRDRDFCVLTSGTYGVQVGGSGLWELSGGRTVTSDGYATSITLSRLAPDWVRAVAETRWRRGAQGSGSVTLTTELTDWRRRITIADWSSFRLQGSYVDDDVHDPPVFNDIAVSGNYSFVGRSGGKGMVLFDVSGNGNPVRIASAFTLNGEGYQSAVRGTTLYVVRGNKDAEVAAYDATNPPSFNSDTAPIATYDLPGNKLGRSIAILGNTLLVGAAESGNPELYTFRISSPSTIVPLHSVNVSGTVWDIHVRGNSAYLSLSEDAMELRVAEVSNPSAISLPSGSGYNLTGNQDAVTVVVTGTSALLGRDNGAAIEEVVLFDLEGGVVPQPPPGPWFFEAENSVNGVDMSPGREYAFVASDFAGKEFRILELRRFVQGQNPEVGFYDVRTVDTDPVGPARALRYDFQSDRVYVATDRAFLVFTPTTPVPRSCP